MKYIVSVDLAQTYDRTAVAVSEVVRLETPEGPPQYDSWLEPPSGPPTHHVRHLERLPLGMDYTVQAERIKSICRRLPSCDLVVDQSGVGRPVVDLLRKESLSPIAVTITSGETESRGDGPNDWRVPKRTLVSGLQLAVQTQRLKVAASLPDAQRWADEMLGFQVEISASGRDTYGNDGTLVAHDDLVIATALGVWWGERNRGGRVIKLVF